MKLVDILARELKAWPEGMRAAYSSGHLVRFSTELGTSHSNVLDIGLEPEDQAIALVSRAEWQAAVDALKIGKLVPDEEMILEWISKPEGAEYWVRSTIPGYSGYWVKYSQKTKTWLGWSGGDIWVAMMPPDIMWKACTPADALIESAAKDLLAALDDVLHGTSREREDAADRAISKARGEA